jgi:hypothetical protein
MRSGRGAGRQADRRLDGLLGAGHPNYRA